MSVFTDMLVELVDLRCFDDQVPFALALDGDSLVLRPMGRFDEMDYR